jgi:hypothetical protein
MNRKGLPVADPSSFRLIYTQLKLIESAGAPLLVRLNLMSDVITDIVAMKNGLKRKNSKHIEELESRVTLLQEEFYLLREGYQPSIERPQYYYGKLGYYEKAFDCLQAEIKSIIIEFNLIDKEAIKEIALEGAAHARINNGG